MNLDPAALAAWTAANHRAGNAEPVDWCPWETDEGPCWNPAGPSGLCKFHTVMRNEANRQAAGQLLAAVADYYAKGHRPCRTTSPTPSATQATPSGPYRR